MLKKCFILTIFTAGFFAPSFSITPNPLISKFKPIYASFSGSPTSLVNGKFGETAWGVKDSSWIALKLELGPKRIFFTWNSTNYMWSDSIAEPGNCIEGLPLPVNYNIMISGNSTNGMDGTWNVVDSVRGNPVAARGHVIDFNSSFWVKMLVIKGGGKIDEVEVFDITDGADDTWFFMGTDITADAFKKPVPFKDFRYFVRDYVKDINPKAIPAIIRGGIGCSKTTSMAADINKYLQEAGNVSYFAIETGTHDAWGGTTENLAAFTKSLQTIITACKKKGIRPIIARIPATDPGKASWQVNEAFLKAIDDLTKKNKLLPGPDLYNWFLQHPDELKDNGVHPTQSGSTSIHRLWAEAVYILYTKDKKTK